jgi:DNA-binding HxlR family transcriptional regulator
MHAKSVASPVTPPLPVTTQTRDLDTVSPLRVSLGCLGRKWALIVLGDIAFLRCASFRQILDRNPGLTPRVLSMRLVELRREGVVERLSNAENGRRILYRISGRGADALPIVAAFIQYGIRHHSNAAVEERPPTGVAGTFRLAGELPLRRSLTRGRARPGGPVNGVDGGP